MPVRKAEAKWNGDLKSGNGTLKLGSGVFEGSYSFSSRFEEGTGTNPEELIGAALAGCFSMALSNELAKAGHNPRSTHTVAGVRLEDGSIQEIELKTRVEVPDMEDKAFQEFAEDARKSCIVSRALSGTKITLDAELV